MASTATDLTREHYQRPEVRETILKFAKPENGGWRALNGDFHKWYAYEGDNIRLLTPDDYDFVTDHYRTLYQTLNVFDQGLWGSWMTSSEKSGENPLGKPTDTMAYSLSVDIDAGPGCDIRDPPVKQAVEGYAQYLIDYLKANGVYNSVWPLFSGGGSYPENGGPI
jgi:hypothetical protein